MTDRVDFYVLNSPTPRERHTFACRLIEKAYLQGLRVVVLSASASEATALDDLLWTFNDRAFVPHRLCRDQESITEDTPVHVSTDLNAAAAADLLVNLSDRLPTGLERFARIAEIIDADPERRRLGRERFKSYRELKLTPNTHQMDGAGEI
ncbi:MAG: DNA polymerase III subunit chi [Steroidobacteraceae bacterium]